MGRDGSGWVEMHLAQSLVEMGRDGSRWVEMGRDGPRWVEMGRDRSRCT